MNNITSTLKDIQREEEGANVKRVIIFNSGLHDVDILCSLKRKKTRTEIDAISNGLPCEDAYRDAMAQLVDYISGFQAELKVFRSTTAGWQKVSILLLERSCTFVTHSAHRILFTSSMVTTDFLGTQTKSSQCLARLTSLYTSIPLHMI